MIACNRSSAASPQRGSWQSQRRGSVASSERFTQRTFAKIIKLPARGFRQNAITIFRWCIIAPYSRIGFLAPVRLLVFLSLLNQHIQLLLNRFAVEDESQKLHHIIVRQNSRLSQKGFQHSGTSAKAVGSLASGKLLDFTFQSFLPVLGCGQLSLRNILVVFQLFQFFVHRQFLLVFVLDMKRPPTSGKRPLALLYDFTMY